MREPTHPVPRRGLVLRSVERSPRLAVVFAVILSLFALPAAADIATTLLTVVHHGAAAAFSSADSLTLLYSAPVAKSADHEVKAGDSAVSAVAWEEFPPTDIPALFRDDSHVQLLTVTNDHATAKICVAYIDRTTGTADCSTLVGSVAETCTDGHSAADADYVMPSSARAFPIRGDQCVFYRATAAATGHFSVVVR